jgi:hypothetical protein
MATQSYNVFLDDGEIVHITVSEASEFENLSYIHHEIERYYPYRYISHIELTEPYP